MERENQYGGPKKISTNFGLPRSRGNDLAQNQDYSGEKYQKQNKYGDNPWGVPAFNFDTKNAENKLQEYNKSKLDEEEEENASVTGVDKFTNSNVAELLKSREPEYNSRDLKRHDRISNRFDAKANRLSNRMDKAYDAGNEIKGDRLSAKLKDAGDDLAGDISGSVSADWGGGAMAAAAAAPGIIDNFTNKPTDKGGINASNLKSTMDFAGIGGAIVPGWGHLIGAAVGFGAGVISNAGIIDEQNQIADNKVRKENRDAIQSRMDQYMDKKTSIQLSAEKDAYAKSLGYSPRSLNS